MRTIVIAPHPDDEVLGVGGTLLRRKAEGAQVAWVIVSSISKGAGYSDSWIHQRSDEIRRVKALFCFDEVYQLEFPARYLDRIPIAELVSAFSAAFTSFQPEEVFVPHPSDVHTDHRVVFSAVSGCAKWFRYPSIKRVLSYETLSETDFGLGVGNGFKPNVFVDIEPYLSQKLKAIDIYSSEVGDFPFPRSHEAILALATLRGASSGFRAAEGFELLRERQ